MNHRFARAALVVLTTFSPLVSWAVADDATATKEAAPVKAEAAYVQHQDIVFADVDGVGLLMDIFTPTGKSNGLGIVDVASGAWFSDRGKINDHKRARMFDTFCGRGYTVFAVRPGSAGVSPRSKCCTT